MSSNSPSLLAVWGKYIPEGAQKKHLKSNTRSYKLLSPSNLPSQQQYDSSVLPSIRLPLNQWTHRYTTSLHLPETVNAARHISPFFLRISRCWTHKRWLQPTNRFDTVYLVETHGCLCFWSFFGPWSLTTADQRLLAQLVPVQTRSPPEITRKKLGLFTHRQESVWGTVYLKNYCWTVYSLQDVPWSN